MLQITANQFDKHFPASEIDLWQNCHWIDGGTEKCPNCATRLVLISDDTYYCRNDGKCAGHAVYHCPGCGAEFHKVDECPAQARPQDPDPENEWEGFL